MGPWTETTSAGGTSTRARCRSRRRRRPTGCAGSAAGWPRAPGRPGAGWCGRPGDRAREPVHGGPGAPRLRGRGSRRVRAGPAHPDARLQHRRGRRRGDLAGRQPVLPGAVGPGARPGGAVPRPDHAPVRDRGAADRSVPRPVRARPALGHRRHHGRAGVPVLGPGVVDQQRLGARLRRGPRGAGLLQGVRRHAGRRRTSPAPPRLHAGQGQRPGVTVRDRGRHDLGTHRGAGRPDRPGVVAALRHGAVHHRDRLRDPAARGRRLQRGRGRAVVAQGRHHLAPGPAADPHPRPGGLRPASQLRAVVPQRLPAHVRRVRAAQPCRPAGQLVRSRGHDRHRGRSGRRRPHPGHARGVGCCGASPRPWPW